MQNTFPSWVKKRLISNEDFFAMKRLLSEYSINTVCESGLCPNICECFSRKFATFLILGRICTRACGFCSVKPSAHSGLTLNAAAEWVKKDMPGTVDPEEPGRISDFVKRLNLKYVIITSVTRDDLRDGGASQFVKVVEAVRCISKGVKVEILVPDFGGRRESIEKVLGIRPDIFSHNIETVRRLYPVARSGAGYERSLDLLKTAKDMDSGQLTKSSLMVGLGETGEEILDTIEDLKAAGCDILTIGQYLRPGKDSLDIERFASPEEFERYKTAGEAMGFKFVSSGPYVRSSYLADEIYYKGEERSYERCCAAAIG